MRAILSSLLAALALTGCSLVPQLDKPAAPVPSTFPQAESAKTETQTAAVGWRSMFPDPALQRLIETALVNNRDLRVATLNVQAVRAQFGIQESARLPQVDAGGSLSRQRTAANAKANPATSAQVETQYGLNAGFSGFEIDLFGRARALSEAAFARYLASVEGQRAAQISLIAAIADAYFAERLAREQLALSRQTLADWQQSLDLARRLKAAQQNSGLDIAQAEGQVAAAEADQEGRSRALDRARNALTLLIGADIPAGLPAGLPLNERAVLTQLPAGLPSDLLTRRPDILQAEQTLIAANADIGAARAAFFPRLTLTGTAGYSSNALSKLFSGGQQVWAFTPQITLPIFTAGRLDAELDLAEIRKSSAVAEYERSIQTAFREVADGLAGSATYRRQIAAQARVVATAERRLELSTLRYRTGLEGRLELLDAQRQLYSARQTQLDLRKDEIANAIALYKALGGGLTETDIP